MPKLTKKTPSYRLHRASGQAVVLLDGRLHYLGSWGTAASRDEYDRLIGEWLANGRRTPPPDLAADRAVVEVIDAYWTFVQAYYRRPDGSPAGEADNIRLALHPLKRLYGRTPVREFGPVRVRR